MDAPDTKGTKAMRKCYALISRFVKAEDGPTAVEYAVMLALIIVVCITAVTALGSNSSNVYSNAKLKTAITGS
jgi:pilus assembly protein Flp/PilA